jgi:hypothetical protein
LAPASAYPPTAAAGAAERKNHADLEGVCGASNAGHHRRRKARREPSIQGPSVNHTLLPSILRLIPAANSLATPLNRNSRKSANPASPFGASSSNQIMDLTA